MKPELSEVISNAARIFTSAKLESASPTIYGLGKQLDVLSIALFSIGDNTTIRDNLMQTYGISSIIQYSEFVMRKIAADEDLSRLIHDRTCSENQYPNTFDPKCQGQRTVNITGQIIRSAEQLAELKSDLYPEVDPTKEVAFGMIRPRPENERYANTSRDLAALKKNLQQAGVASR